MADRATLLHLLVWCKPVQGYLLMWREQLDSRAWVAKRTAEVLERGAQAVPGGSVDVEQVANLLRFSWSPYTNVEMVNGVTAIYTIRLVGTQLGIQQYQRSNSLRMTNAFPVLHRAGVYSSCRLARVPPPPARALTLALNSTGVLGWP